MVEALNFLHAVRGIYSCSGWSLGVGVAFTEGFPSDVSFFCGIVS